MNLEPDAAQRQLAGAVRKNEASVESTASGWKVFDAVGITEALAAEPGAPPVLGQVDWCLVFEELGAGCRDHQLIRSVRTFLDVYGSGPGAGPAAAAFRHWAHERRSAPGPPDAIVERTTGEGRGVWRITAGQPAPLNALPEVELNASAAREVADRELLAVAAYAVGVGRRCLEAAQQRADARVIAGRRLLEYQGTSHRLARCAVDLSIARAGLWRAALAEDEGERAGHRAPACAAACLSTALDCAHNVVQVFGAAGTSDPAMVRLFRTAYSLPAVTGSVSALWRSAGARRLPSLV
ncbi:acyl-CoA dehydrogenase family protein [Streptomyces niveus]|uniref:acyl-CoA dehydrogenase family protein n=1 Tax=Streptomyces niveus TaxID=193462 RepID=UPI0036944E37